MSAHVVELLWHLFGFSGRLQPLFRTAWQRRWPERMPDWLEVIDMGQTFSPGDERSALLKSPETQHEPIFVSLSLLNCQQSQESCHVPLL